jgi:hypothetical protein
MIHSSRSDRRAKAVAEVLAMIARAQYPVAPHRSLPIRNAREWLPENATQLRAAPDVYARHAQGQNSLSAAQICALRNASTAPDGERER